MKKKISLLLCILIISFSFAGCSGKKNDAATYDKDTLEQSAEFIITNFSSMDDATLDSFKEVSNFQLDYTMLQTGLKVSGEAFVGMINSWQAAEAECGKYQSHGDYEIEEKADGYVVSTSAQYEGRKATISITFDEQMNMESLDVSAKFSTKEILTKAGLNTVLGMGVVFAVLIFLAFVIDLMKYIPKLLEQSNSEKKVVKAEEKAASTPVAVPVATPVVTSSDDLELVAVITAAIAAQEGTSTDGFVVRSIRRRPSNNWN